VDMHDLSWGWRF